MFFRRPNMLRKSIPGGDAEKKKVTKEDVDSKEFEMGLKEEKEHTDDPKVAEEIALDHLASDPKYYTKLKKMVEKS